MQYGSSSRFFALFRQSTKADGKAGHRGLHDVQQLGEQLFAARDGRKRLHTSLVEYLAGIGAGLQHQFAVI